jgi:hypothetical protein
MARKTLPSATKPAKTRRYAKELPVTLSPSEFETKAKSLATKIAEKDALLAKKREATKDFTDRIMIASREQEKLRKTIETGTEERMVECEETSDFDQNRCVIRRLDTGEIVSERAMDSDERDRLAQGDLLKDVPGSDPQPEA